MSNTKLEVGDPVRVVAPDPNCGDATHVGKYGIITDIDSSLDYDHIVHLENDTSYPFVASELVKVEAKVIKGLVTITRDDFNFLEDVIIDGCSLRHEADDQVADGDEVRLTIEVIRKGNVRVNTDSNNSR